jgi:hypothetical protein
MEQEQIRLDFAAQESKRVCRKHQLIFIRTRQVKPLDS